MTTTRPIICTGESVRAYMDLRKTETRRVMKVQPDYVIDNEPYWHVGGFRLRPEATNPLRCPYGKPGDRLWVKETWQQIEWWGQNCILYRAHCPDDCQDLATPSNGIERIRITKWRPSLFMPRWASRLTLEIVSLRAERLQDITFDSCLAEGIVWTEQWDTCKGETITGDSMDEAWDQYTREAYRDAWDAINAKRGYSWDSNPWVWVLQTKLVTTMIGDNND